MTRLWKRLNLARWWRARRVFRSRKRVLLQRALEQAMRCREEAAEDYYRAPRGIQTLRALRELQEWENLVFDIRQGLRCVAE